MIGDIELNEDEVEALKMSPDFAVFNDMDDKTHQAEVLVSNTGGKIVD